MRPGKASAFEQEDGGLQLVSSLRVRGLLHDHRAEVRNRPHKLPWEARRRLYLGPLRVQSRRALEVHRL